MTQTQIRQNVHGHPGWVRLERDDLGFYTTAAADENSPKYVLVDGGGPPIDKDELTKEAYNLWALHEGDAEVSMRAVVDFIMERVKNG